MSAKRTLLVVLVASAVMLAVGVGPRFAGSAHALPPAQAPDPVGVTVPYPGRLSDEGGQPVADGTYDFAFALHDAETGGEPLWSEVQEGVAVQAGAFNVLLGGVNGIPVEALGGGERWLAVGVRGPGEAEFTTLNPRQRLSAASPDALTSPAAGLTCPHDHWGETWESDSGTGLQLGNSGMFSFTDVDLGALNGSAIESWSMSYAGVKGRSTFADGVVGETFASGKSGVYGHSADGFGVTGRSTNNYGVQGFGISGVYGDGSIGVRGHGSTYGVYGKGEPYGAGVCGESSVAAGVLGESDSAAGVGAFSDSGPGLVANSNSGDIIQAWSGSVDVEFKVDIDGDVYADRAYHCGLGTGGEPGICIIQNSAAADFAEMLPSDEGVKPGDVLAIDSDGRLARSTEAYQTTVVGVYSTEPGYLGGGEHLGQDGYAPLAVVGIVPVKASAENGPITPGDLLVASSTPGHAMKAGPNPPIGTVIGKALEVLNEGTGAIQMLVTLQ